MRRVAHRKMVGDERRRRKKVRRRWELGVVDEKLRSFFLELHDNSVIIDMSSAFVVGDRSIRLVGEAARVQ